MIKIEKLRELIKERKTIWTLYYGLRAFDFSKMKKRDYRLDEDCLHIYGCCYGEAYDDEIGFGWLFETKEDAEWHKEFSNIERTEKLQLTSFDRLLDGECTIFKDHRHDSVYELYAQDGTIIIEEDHCPIFIQQNNWENYLKACRLCKELFLGEKDD